MDTVVPSPSPFRITLPCWNCGESCADIHVCAQCASVLPCPPAVDHFSILGLQKRYTVDQNQLRQAYLSLSRRFHPDRFAQKSTKERRISVEKSTAINEAYKTLSDPIKRAEYLLAREANLTDLEKLRAAPDILESVLETRERILELREESSPQSAQELQSLKQQKLHEESEIFSRLHSFFASFDRGDCTVLSSIEREIVLYRYNKGILQELSIFK